ncbi:MAG: DUF4091 domain-containing protein [Candidatus Hydrogenedentes bacterium]|nr:DUF4091 domain-containing protein [Candidatus Hydrogenedentota bacterium]
MDEKLTVICAMALVGMLTLSGKCYPASIEYWTTHSLDKVFPDTPRPEGASVAITLRAARNETEDAQVIVRVPKGVEISSAHFSLPDLAGPNGATFSKENLSAYWVWYTYVLNNPKENTDPSMYLRRAPAFFPDAFLENPVIRIRDEWTQPLWVSVRVPKGTGPGTYSGALAIDLTDGAGQATHFDVPLELRVWPFTLPDEPRLHHTEWFSVDALANYYRIAPWTEECWAWIEKVAEDMARHKQDTILTPFWGLVQVRQDAAGALQCDFTALDRWVETFKKAGVTWIEGSHVAGRSGGWESPIIWGRFHVLGADGQPLELSPSKVSEEQFEPYMKAYLQAVHAHLKERGWAERYVQHIADEPIPANEASWIHRAKCVRKWLPGVPIIDAVMSEGLEGAIDIRVPQIQHVKPAKQRKSKEVFWSYVCLAPQGKYPNRFLDYPSIRNRILFWLSYTHDLEGFLHWGYNYWLTWSNVPAPVDVSPWLDATGASIYCADRLPLPAGDPHIVYPGKNRICSSIRWEVVRKGIEDYGYLYLLDDIASHPKKYKAKKADVDAARKLLKRVKTDIAAAPDKHTMNDQELISTREQLGNLLAAVIGERS